MKAILILDPKLGDVRCKDCFELRKSDDYFHVSIEFLPSQFYCPSQRKWFNEGQISRFKSCKFFIDSPLKRCRENKKICWTCQFCEQRPKFQAICFRYGKKGIRVKANDTCSFWQLIKRRWF